MLGCHRLCTGGHPQWWPVQSRPASVTCCHLGVHIPKMKAKSEIVLTKSSETFSWRNKGQSALNLIYLSYNIRQLYTDISLYKNIFFRLLQNWEHGEPPANGNLLNKLCNGCSTTIKMAMRVCIYWNELCLEVRTPDFRLVCIKRLLQKKYAQRKMTESMVCLPLGGKIVGGFFLLLFVCIWCFYN